MTRRQAALALAALAAGCGPRADLISFDRGEFALTYGELYSFSQGLLSAAIAKNTKGGSLNQYAQGLKAFADRLAQVDERVRKAILEAPANDKAARDAGIGEITAILSKALPLLLPLLAAAAA